VAGVGPRLGVDGAPVPFSDGDTNDPLWLAPSPDSEAPGRCCAEVRSATAWLRVAERSDVRSGRHHRDGDETAPHPETNQPCPNSERCSNPCLTTTRCP
jgi:hypothetical protein